MEPTRREVTETIVQGDGVTSRQEVVATKTEKGYKIEQIVWLLFGILASLLALRFVLVLLAANQSNGFANLIYSATYPFVAPFFGLFGSRFQYGVTRVEVETLVAIAVYALVTWAIVKLIRIIRH